MICLSTYILSLRTCLITNQVWISQHDHSSSSADPERSTGLSGESSWFSRVSRGFGSSCLYKKWKSKNDTAAVTNWAKGCVYHLATLPCLTLAKSPGRKPPPDPWESNPVTALGSFRKRNNFFRKTIKLALHWMNNLCPETHQFLPYFTLYRFRMAANKEPSL